MKPARHRARIRRPAGFTLVELMIALTLLTMLMTILFAALRHASRASEAGDQANDRANDALLVHDWLRREFAQAQPLLLRNGDDAARIAFSGRAETLGFVAPLPAHLGGGGLYWIELSLEDSADALQLVLSERPFAPGSESTERVGRRVLANDLTTAGFSYFGAREDDPEPIWQSEWLDRDVLPLLIQLRMEPSDDRFAWPALIIQPKVDGVRTVD